MSLTARFLTTTREDIFEITRRLIGALDNAILQDPKNPLIIAVEGTHASGKSIVNDAAREILFDKEPVMTGRSDYDEYWHGQRKSVPLQLMFLNAAWPGGYDNPDVKNSFFDGTKIREFLEEREAGGISIVQNSCGWQDNAGMVIHIEEDQNNHGDPYGKYDEPDIDPHRDRNLDDPSIRFIRHPALMMGLFTLSETNKDARYIEIEVRDPRLLASTSFRTAFDQFAPIEEPDTWRAWFENLNTIPNPPPHIYGKDIPRAAP